MYSITSIRTIVGLDQSIYGKFAVMLFLVSGIVLLFRTEAELADYKNLLTSKTISNEGAYLPQPELVKLTSLGFNNALSHLIWFSTISYFGKHYETDHDFRWLYHRCNLITELNPNALHVYEFGSTMLSWEQNAPEDSVKLLTKAINNFPGNWKLYYLRGFNYLYFLKDKVRAKNDFLKSSKLPGVHPTIVSLAAKQLTEVEGNAVAKKMLLDMLNDSKDPSVINALKKRLKIILKKEKLQ